MYAVVESGSLQFSVSEGDLIRIPKIAGEPGSAFDIDKVLLLAGEGAPLVGKPYVDGAKVETEVVGQGKADKVLVFKFKRRTKYRRLRGHRQPYTELKVSKIVVPA
ncbi:MAG: 50S ribosomal protein L21 [bacterium]